MQYFQKTKSPNNARIAPVVMQQLSDTPLLLDAPTIQKIFLLIAICTAFCPESIQQTEPIEVLSNIGKY